MNMEIPFIGGAYTARSSNLNAQVCQNLYLEMDNTGAKNLIALVGCPGMKLWLNPGTVAEVRALKVFKNRLYAVIGASVYKIEASKDASLIGTLGTNSGWVDITDDGVYTCVFDSLKGWVWDGATFAEIADPDYPEISGATYQDGYHIVSRFNTDQFFICTQDDPTAWDATDYATAEGSGDSIIIPICVERELWLINEHSTEIWYNSGDTFPFTRSPGGYLSIGCNSRRSVATLGNELMFLDDKNRVVQKKGLQLAPASTYQIDYLISTLGDTGNSVGLMYIQEGHHFYELTFPADNKTICFDLTTGFWHTRASGEPSLRSRANCAVNFAGMVMVGDYENGNIYEYDLGTYTDNEETKVAIRAAQVISKNNQFIFFNSFELDMEVGVGDITTTDPQAMLDWSDDGGKTWSNEHWNSMGAVGEYDKRVRWRRLGKSRSRIFRVKITDPVKRNIINAYLDGTVGDAKA